jgi:hypothetical protein
MSDLLFQQDVVQSSPTATSFHDQLPFENILQGTSLACVVDFTPPTFAGITSLTVEARGQLRANWSAATDATAPIRYQVYIKPATATGLFSAGNIVGITSNLQLDIFTLPDGSLPVAGDAYYVGVRAFDGVGNLDGNTVSLNIVSPGLGSGAETYESKASFAVNENNDLQGTLWVNKNGQLMTSSLGTASYQVYDDLGAHVPTMSESGIVADANGQFKITPVTSALIDNLTHYIAKVTVIADGAERSSYIPLVQAAPEYNINGLFFINESNQFDGSFWVMADEIVRTSGIGLASYQVYDSDGSPVVGMSGSGISADVNGVYKISAVSSTLLAQNLGYSVRVSLVIDGLTRSDMIPVEVKRLEYECKGTFSINALNQFQATLWAVADGVVKTTSLGTASYTVYDKDGVAVSGLSQTGITADVNGRFNTTPVSAALLTNLTHYTVKIAITVSGLERVSYKGFTLLGN